MVGRAEDCGRRAAAALSLLAAALASLSVGAWSAQEPERLRPGIVGAVTEYAVRPGDTLASLGARYGVSVAAVAHDNELAADMKLVVGHVLRIDNRHIVPSTQDAGTILINVAQRMLFYTGGDDRVAGYPVAVGRSGWQTPTNEFVVVAKERHPIWDVPASILEESRKNGRSHPARVPPGPDNPLGAFWIGLSLPSIGIHGTNAPSSIFRAVTHGCIRMHPDHVAQLFGRVQVGARGRTIYEPVLMAAQDGAIYLEVHRDIYRRGSASARALAQVAGWSELIDWDVADAVVAAADGVAREVTHFSTSERPRR